MALRTKVKALLAGGASAIVIAAAMLGGNHGLEGRRHEPYRDVAGVLTVCDGHTGKDILPGKHYTDAECDALLNKDLALVAARIDPLIKASIPNSERAALYSFAYNVGTGAFARSGAGTGTHVLCQCHTVSKIRRIESYGTERIE